MRLDICFELLEIKLKISKINGMASQNFHFKSEETSQHSLVNWDDTSRFTDLEVWRAFKNGSESAFIYIYEKYFPTLMNYGFKFSKDKELIQDCIQDMFIDLRESRAKLSDTDNIKPYLFKVFRRRIFQQQKSITNQTDIDEEFRPFEFTISHEEHLINQQFSEQQISKLKEAVVNLSLKEREAIFHFYYELHSYDQIAEIMGYSDVKTARNLVYRAINSLRQTLEASSSDFFLFSFTFL